MHLVELPRHRIPPLALLAGATMLAIAAGGCLAIRPVLLIPLPFIALFVFSAERSAQLVLALGLIEGATAPFGQIAGLDPVFLCIWILVLRLYFSQGEPVRGIQRGVVVAVFAYAGCLLFANVLHEGPGFLSQTLSLINYVGAFLLTAMLARMSPALLLLPLLAALAVHEVLAATELLTNSSWFYADWKTLQATKVNGITRVSSTVADPNYFAVTLILLTTAALTLARKTRLEPSATALAATAALLLPFTFSRAAAIAVFVAVFAWAVRAGLASATRLAIRGVTLAACAVLLVVVVAPDAPGALLSRYSPSQNSDASIESRGALQKMGFREALAHPLTGIGSGSFEAQAKATFDPTKPNNLQTDVLNTYLQVWLAGGLVALLAFAMALLLPTWRLVRRGLLLGFGLTGVAVALFTLNGLTLIPLWCALGIAAVIAGEGSQGADGEAASRCA